MSTYVVLCNWPDQGNRVASLQRGQTKGREQVSALFLYQLPRQELWRIVVLETYPALGN